MMTINMGLFSLASTIIIQLLWGGIPSSCAKAVKVIALEAG
jgi:hypothetical protein